MTVTGITGKTHPGTAGTGNWINVIAGFFHRQSSSAGAARWVSVDNLGNLGPLAVSISVPKAPDTTKFARLKVTVVP